MTPGKLINLPFFQGAKWSFAFRFVVTDTDTPLDLTGLGPFVCKVEAFATNTQLATAEIVSDYDNEGTITVTFTPAQTITFPLGEVGIGVRDAFGNPYLEGYCEVNKFAPRTNLS